MWRTKQEESFTHFFNEAIYPKMEDFDMLVVMGGNMNIYEHKQFPWLIGEKRFIKKAIETNKKILGICLGAQLVADVLGGKITKNKYSEIGWFPKFKTKDEFNQSITKSIHDGQIVMHWHGDTFSIPEGATQLFYSEACNNQAFIYQQNVLAIQFHIELTPELLKCLVELESLPEGSYVQTPKQIIESKSLQAEAHNSLYRLIDNFILYE